MLRIDGRIDECAVELTDGDGMRPLRENRCGLRVTGVTDDKEKESCTPYAAVFDNREEVS